MLSNLSTKMEFISSHIIILLISYRVTATLEPGELLLLPHLEYCPSPALSPLVVERLKLASRVGAMDLQKRLVKNSFVASNGLDFRGLAVELGAWKPWPNLFKSLFEISQISIGWSLVPA